MTDELLEQARVFLPKYLTPSQQQELYSELRKFPERFTYYLDSSKLQEELLQGDGWRGFVVLDFQTSNRKTVSGVVLSNSCDVSNANQWAVQTNVLFAPMVRVERYAERLRQTKDQQQVDSILEGIRRQRASSIFYLPSMPGGHDESIIRLDDIHTHPLPDFLEVEKSQLFTLNQHAFYLFLIKLSIHFTRFQEDIARYPDATPG